MHEREIRARIFHNKWEVAIHEFCRNFKDDTGESPSLDCVQSFHETWYQNKANRRNAHIQTRCKDCEDVVAEYLLSGDKELLNPPLPVLMKLAEYGIILKHHRV